MIMNLAPERLRHAADLGLCPYLVPEVRSRCASALATPTWLSPVIAGFESRLSRWRSSDKKTVDNGEKACTVRAGTREEWLRRVAVVWGAHLRREVTMEEALEIDAGMSALCRAFIETEKKANR